MLPTFLLSLFRTRKWNCYKFFNLLNNWTNKLINLHNFCFSKLSFSPSSSVSRVKQQVNSKHRPGTGRKRHTTMRHEIELSIKMWATGGDGENENIHGNDDDDERSSKNRERSKTQQWKIKYSLIKHLDRLKSNFSNVNLLSGTVILTTIAPVADTTTVR